MRIQRITTRTGHSVDLGHLTVLVGPNNVGKSQTLRDIHNRIVIGRNPHMVILDEVAIEAPPRLDDWFARLRVDDDPRHAEQSILRGVKSNLLGGEEVRIPLERWTAEYQREGEHDRLLQQIGKFRIAFLNAKTRLQIAESTPSHNPYEEAPQRLLQALYEAPDEIQERFRTAFRDAFDMDVLLDYSGLKQLYLRVAREFPDVPAEPKEAHPILREFAPLDDQGDGYRSFVAVVLSLLLFDDRILLIDEPEAFLHPLQARKLGVLVAQLAANADSQVIVATHNAHFLAGILEGGVDAEILRLNRTQNDTRYQRVSPDDIDRLTNSPLLSSQRVLEAIFHRGVVVCEADSDRIFYQTVAAERLGTRDLTFVHAHNKQTIHQVVRLLKSAGVPTAAVVDLDIINSETDLRRLCEAFDIGDKILDTRAEIAGAVEEGDDDEIIGSLLEDVTEFLQQLRDGEHTLSGARAALRRIDASASRWRPVKRRGIDGLPEGVQDAARQLVSTLAGDGLFVVPVGELEGWIDLGTRRKKRWIVLALRHIRTESAPRALRQFVEQVSGYLSDKAAENRDADGGDA